MLIESLYLGPEKEEPQGRSLGSVWGSREGRGLCLCFSGSVRGDSDSEGLWAVAPSSWGGESAVCSCLFDVLQAPRRKEKLPLRPSFPSQCFLCFYFLISKIARTRKGDFWNAPRLSAASSPRLSTGVRVAGDPEPEADSCSPERCWLEGGEFPQVLLLLRCLRDLSQGSSPLRGDPEQHLLLFPQGGL